MLKRLSVRGSFFILSMNHIQVSIKATSIEQEILMARLVDLGATGFEETPTHLISYLVNNKEIQFCFSNRFNNFNPSAEKAKQILS